MNKIIKYLGIFLFFFLLLWIFAAARVPILGFLSFIILTYSAKALIIAFYASPVWGIILLIYLIVKKKKKKK